MPTKLYGSQNYCLCLIRKYCTQPYRVNRDCRLTSEGCWEQEDVPSSCLWQENACFIMSAWEGRRKYKGGEKNIIIYLYYYYYFSQIILIIWPYTSGVNKQHLHVSGHRPLSAGWGRCTEQQRQTGWHHKPPRTPTQLPGRKNEEISWRYQCVLEFLFTETISQVLFIGLLSDTLRWTSVFVLSFNRLPNMVIPLPLLH